MVEGGGFISITRVSDFDGKSDRRVSRRRSVVIASGKKNYHLVKLARSPQLNSRPRRRYHTAVLDRLVESAGPSLSLRGGCEEMMQLRRFWLSLSLYVGESIRVR